MKLLTPGEPKSGDDNLFEGRKMIGMQQTDEVVLGCIDVDARVAKTSR